MYRTVLQERARAIPNDGNRPVKSSADIAEGVIAIGGSAGALVALRTLMRTLRADSGPAFVLAMHGTDTVLLALLQDQCALPVTWATPDIHLRPGCVYVAPPSTHIVVRPDGSLRTPRSARRDAYRPSVDWLFESAAATYGEAAAGVVLSGTMWDGVAGAKAIRRAVGRMFAQQLETAAYPEMPRAVIASGATCIAPPDAIAELLSDQTPQSLASHQLYGT